MVDVRHAREHSFWKETVRKEATSVRTHQLLQELYGGGQRQVPFVHSDHGLQKIDNVSMRPAGVSGALRFPEDRKGYRDWGSVSAKCKSRWRAVQRQQRSPSKSLSSFGSSERHYLVASCAGTSDSSLSTPGDTAPQGGSAQKTAPVPARPTRPRPRTASGARCTMQDVATHNQTLYPEQAQEPQQPRRVQRPKSAPSSRRPLIHSTALVGGFPTEHAAQAQGSGPCGYPGNAWLDGLRDSAANRYGQPWRS
eukprot:gnl/MRDRNA2_/MRDRNA2_107609_c0_seq1.p1 gnl/MRDRNA2_/MRDRNA2_107609_c0~~gnl/MRDRNA2_/MRDRNA2_107609_c0_seq1.p1  ORF type:complete len:252 (-),score=31.20 gnl/MRDRNA2_/MRDRNA2_107609_c0_seq1:11-766(-)